VVSNHKLQKMAKVKLNFKVIQFTELTDAQWAIIEKIVDTGRKIKKDLRMIVNCIFKITRTGCQWRNIDEKYGPWQSVYYYFQKWSKNGILSTIMTHLVHKERIRQGKEAEATASAIDSQTVKKSSFIQLDTGIDGNKCINGRKRNILVDTLGLPIAIFVCAANIQDGIAGIELLPFIDKTTGKLKLIRADNAYRNDFIQAAQWCGYTVEVSQKPPSVKGFIPQTGRWQVERTFAWQNFYRRLAKDFEKTVDSSVAFIQLAFCSIILSKF
jgi:putative transposase